MAPEGTRVRLLDYGVGNVRSVRRALEAAGAVVETSEVVGGDCLVLPGVGAFGEARMRLAGQWDALRDHALLGRPLLGICLGMQLLFERSHEHGLHDGLGIFPGEVVPLPHTVTVPHMGWQTLCGLSDPTVYFAHSFGVPANAFATATVEHGGLWTAAVRRGAVWGFQFHPEKSGAAGLALLRAWLLSAAAATT